MRKTTPETPLLEVCESYYFPLNLRIRKDTTKYQYRIAIRHLARFLQREPTIADLDDDVVTAFMRWRMDEGTAVRTVEEQAARLQALWTWLAKRRDVDRFPTFVKPEPPETQPTALRMDQLQALFRSAAKERGSIGGIPAALWWLSFLAFVFNTAERKSAALSLKVAWVDLARGLVTIPPEFRKGGKKWGNFQLWPETVPLIQQCIAVDPLRELVWPFPLTLGSYYTRFDRILADAGIPVTRRHKTHALRCTHATMRKAVGGDATRALLHSDAATTERYYIDQRMIPEDNSPLCIPWEGQQPTARPLPIVPPSPAAAVAAINETAWL